MESQLWNMHITPHTHIITLEQNTSRTLGIFNAHYPKTMQAATLPLTQISEGMMP